MFNLRRSTPETLYECRVFQVVEKDEEVRCNRSIVEHTTEV